MKPTWSKPEIVTRKGKPVSDVIPTAEKEALKRGMEERLKESEEKGTEVEPKA